MSSLSGWMPVSMNRVRAKSPSAPLFLPLLQVFAGNIFAAWLLERGGLRGELSSLAPLDRLTALFLHDCPKVGGEVAEAGVTREALNEHDPLLDVVQGTQALVLGAVHGWSTPLRARATAARVRELRPA